MKTKLFLLVFIGAILLACQGEPKIDTSTDETFKASVSKIRASLPEANKNEFDESIKILSINPAEPEGAGNINQAASSNMTDQMRTKLNGIRAAQVITEARLVKQERYKIEQMNAQKEIDQLEAKLKSYTYNREQLDRIKILDSKFYMLKHEMRGNAPVIELRVENKTPFAVSKTYFEFHLTNPGSSNPFYQGNLQYDIYGGLESGASSHWFLSSDVLSVPEIIKAPRNTKLNIEIVRVDGPDGNVLFSAEKLSEKEGLRLSELKAKYNK